MKFRGIIVDANFCIKVGASPKYRYLEKVLVELADKVYIHKVVYNEILTPICAKEQVDSLRKQGIHIWDSNAFLRTNLKIHSLEICPLLKN